MITLKSLQCTTHPYLCSHQTWKMNYHNTCKYREAWLSSALYYPQLLKVLQLLNGMNQAQCSKEVEILRIFLCEMPFSFSNNTGKHII